MQVAILCFSVLNSVGLFALAAHYFTQKTVKRPPNEELADFLTDVKIHGYGVVRLDPDALLLRSPRS